MVSKFSINASINGLDEFIVCSKEVTKKAEELQKAIQRLNKTKLELETKFLSE
ncbi:hypothetical protein [Streptococcus sp. zg-JUN1979]|uniref:hypothetical protein n=1 Tax=Streptococcus sp. zg-JUN1979 TaxID=3391450 RepID=UPI0039A55035